MNNKIIHPEGWAPTKGYANGVLAGDGTLYVGGQVGWTAEQVFVDHSFIGQMEQVLRNILAVVEAADGTAEDLVRLTWFVKDKKEYLAHQREIGQAYRRVLGSNFPAMSMVVVLDLIEDEALLEVEATAFLDGK
ncbi:MAG: RidA family protein [Rhodobacteraceae bacterium]|nr:RidA family protein [Paracoccaceae bacterium]